MAGRWGAKGGRRRGRRSKPTFSSILQREFDSEGECRRGEYLYAMEQRGEISGLAFQRKVHLGTGPIVTWTLDFVYEKDGCVIFEDYKGSNTNKAGAVKTLIERETRVKLSWARSMGYDCRIVINDGRGGYRETCEPPSKFNKNRHGLFRLPKKDA